MKKLTIACTLGLFATAPALAVDDMTATAETFTRALLQHDGTAAAALVALPAGGKISREQLAQCISAQSARREQCPRACPREWQGRRCRPAHDKDL